MTPGHPTITDSLAHVRSINPKTGDSTDLEFGVTSPSQLLDVCERAANAAGDLRCMRPAARAGMLRAMGAGLRCNADALVGIADRESALGTGRLSGELERTARQLELFAAVLEDGHCFEVIIDHADADASPPIPDLRRMLVPVGPVAVFGPSNFPFAFSAAGGDTASAIAAGCPVVVKAHSAHPDLDTQVCGILAEVAATHGLPSGTVTVVHGRQAGTELVTNPQIQAVGFTGSETAGRTLMDLAAGRPHPIPVYAEMGSLNPLVVTDRIAEDRADAVADQIARSVTVGHGQFCTKPGLVFAPRGRHGDRVTAALTAALRSVPEQYMLSRSIQSGYRAHTGSLQARNGVIALIPDRNPTGSGSSAATALSQTDAASLMSDKSLLVECFGPSTLIVRYDDTAELVAALEAVPAALTLSVHADESETDLLAALARIGERRTGRVIFNDVPTGVAVTWAQNHAGPYPAASGQFSSVGATALRRWQRPVTYQGWPDRALPAHLQEANPLELPRRVDGRPDAPQGHR